MNISRLLNLLRHWGIKSGLGILDQGMYSAANFIVSILLAKWLEKNEFGAFSVGFAILMVFLQIYTSFVLEPMSVLGPSNHKNHLINYLLGQVRLLLLLSIPIGIVFGLVGLLNLFIGNTSSLTPILMFSSIGIPFILFSFLMRRVYYVLSQPGIALLGSFVYFCFLIFFVFSTRHVNMLSGNNGVLIIAMSGFISGSLLFAILTKKKSQDHQISLSKMLIETWTFGKWLLLSGVFIGLATQSQVYLTGHLYRVDEAGGVRILQTFIQPMMLTSTALSALATPIIAADFVSHAYHSMKQKIVWFTVSLGLLSLGYEALLYLFGKNINHWLFDGKYASVTDQILVWGLFPILLSLYWGGVITLQASQRPEAMLIISGSWAALSILAGLIFIPEYGSWGATISMFAGYFAALICTWCLYWFWVHRVYMMRKE